MSELNISVVIMQENMLISEEIYTTGKNFTLPPAVTAVTNSTSADKCPNHCHFQCTYHSSYHYHCHYHCHCHGTRRTSVPDTGGSTPHVNRQPQDINMGSAPQLLQHPAFKLIKIISSCSVVLLMQS